MCLKLFEIYIRRKKGKEKSSLWWEQLIFIINEKHVEPLT